MNSRESTAVVMGGSVAGLAASLALAQHVERVVVVERHREPLAGRPESIVPQGSFPHVLLPGGAAALERLAPGFAEDLRRAGAVGGDGERRCHWWAAGAVRRSLPDLGIDAPMCSRELVEATLRDRALQHGRIELRWGTAVRGLHLRGDRIAGVELAETEGIAGVEAGIVVDATGRAARSIAWLNDLGYTGPELESIGIDLTYVSVEVERVGDDLGGSEFVVVQNSDRCARIGVALPTELGRWRVVLGGYFGDQAPRDRTGMLAWAGSLPDPAIRTLLDRPWVAEPRRHRFPTSQRRDWTRVPLPEGFAAIGDSVASFNPIYGQGMSSAALQAEALAGVMERNGPGVGLSRAVARRTARVVANPWQVSAGSDFMYAETYGAKPRGTDMVNRYLELVMRAAATDPVVNLALTRVQGLLAEPRTLMSPRVMSRVLGRQWRDRRQAAAQPLPTVTREPAAPVTSIGGRPRHTSSAE